MRKNLRLVEERPEIGRGKTRYERNCDRSENKHTGRPARLRDSKFSLLQCHQSDPDGKAHQAGDIVNVKALH